MKLRNIEILEKETNKKGDLFGRLMSDFFHTLGYDEPGLNIHKSGREIDLRSSHRTEHKIAIAECKAHSTTIGGADINKFIGVIDAEKIKLKKDKDHKGFSLVGYFISLSGFKETAVEQENDCDNKRVILIKPEKIVEELIRGKILVSPQKAISSLLSLVSDKLSLIEQADLLAYNNGWVWAIYYSDSNGQKISHFALVHAEGKPLIKDLADKIILIDANLNKLFEGLILLNTEEVVSVQQNLDKTREKYFEYLENELGEVQFEGLPTDKEAGSVKVKLENIFVPLHLTQSKTRKKDEFDIDENKREGIGEILNKKSKLAILAKPGGGKSTLLKRIAIAYAFPDRREKINDKLPNVAWFPIFLRCRELGERVTLSITEIIHGIPARAEIHSCANDFSILVSNSLQNGSALLLIDGLDEIADDKNRIAFVNQLRTFIATYPTINIIVTSREAGFRIVASFLATYCENYTVSNLTKYEIKELCLKWHKAIIDESENTIREANKLSDLIVKDRRISALAENPLLLTTLLFVKRWAGYLPTKRSVLYQEMIKLLLVTWNVEGHEIIDIDEAEPQLAFVAYWMTKNGQQTISADDLNNCLVDARKQMPEILGYTNISPSEFIKRVESRSSLLIMTGHKKLESGSITAIYEFLHLSFQEYLTAKAIVKKFIPQSDCHNRVVDIIKPNINNENWKEVIPLVAVLLERDTKELIEYLISESKLVPLIADLKDKKNRQVGTNFSPSLLGSCLANEIQISPELLGTAIEWYAKNTYSILDKENTEIILKSKFGESFRKIVKECFFEEYNDEYSAPLGSVLADIFTADNRQIDNDIGIPYEVLKVLKSNQKEDKCIALLGMMSYFFRASRLSSIKDKDTPPAAVLEDIFNEMLKLLKTNDPHYQFSISWCIAWSGDTSAFPDSARINFVRFLLKIWVYSCDYNLRRIVSWALEKILMPSIQKNEISKIKNIKKVINNKYINPENEFDKLVSIYLKTIIGESLDVIDVKEELKQHQTLGLKRHGSLNNLFQFAKHLDIDLKENLKMKP
jgi:arsenate reductase-like glutaredoxin family protein